MYENTTFTFHLSDGQTTKRVKVTANSIRDAERYFKKHLKANLKGGFTILMVLPDFCKPIAA